MLKVLPAALVFVLFLAGVAFASPVIFDFSGTVTQLPVLDPNDPFTGGIAPGTTFSGSYTFDSVAVDGAGDPNTGSYASSGAPFGLTLRIGTFIFSANAFLVIGIANDYASADQYTLLATNTTGPDTYDLEIYLEGADTILSNDGLPLTPLRLNDFTIKEFHLTNGFIGGNQVQIDGQIDSFTTGTTPVPEPGTALLLTTGILGALATLRRRS